MIYGSLADVPHSFDMVDIFRNSEAAFDITKEAIAIAADKKIQTIWMQLTVRNDKAEKFAEKAGLVMVMDRCVKIEYGRLYGELSWSGVNSKIISARRPRLQISG